MSLSSPALPRRLHLLGAGGAGVSGAARLLLAQGFELSGHDRAHSDFVDVLNEAGVPIAIGASEASLLPPDAGGLVRSAAIGTDDPQVVEAVRRGLPVLKYAELVGRLAPARRTLGVAGTHGKTTTSWMLFEALRGVREVAGLPAPGALVGGIHRGLRTNAVVPEPGGWFAVEACEYDRTFLQLSPEAAIITNVEADHLDYYGDLETLETAFARFAARVHPDGLLVVGPEVPERVTSAAACAVWRLGRELRIDLASEKRGRFHFRLRGPGWATPAVALQVPGSFNVDNAALALGLAIGLAERDGLSPLTEAVAGGAFGVSRFDGVARRFESWGRVDGIEVVHDYAHHPTEVRATLEAAQRAFPRRPVHVLFQPHQHSRTARFMAEFVEALRGADRVVVADVYGARTHIDSRAAREGGAEELVRRLQRAGVAVVEGGSPARSAEAFANGIDGRAAALVLGAGDIDRIRAHLLERLASRPATLEPY